MLGISHFCAHFVRVRADDYWRYEPGLQQRRLLATIQQPDSGHLASFHPIRDKKRPTTIERLPRHRNCRVRSIVVVLYPNDIQFSVSNFALASSNLQLDLFRISLANEPPV